MLGRVGAVALLLVAHVTPSLATLRPLITSGVRGPDGRVIATIDIPVARSTDDVLFTGTSSALRRRTLDGGSEPLLSTGDRLPAPLNGTINQITGAAGNGLHIALTAMLDDSTVDGAVFRLVDGTLVPVDLERAPSRLSVNASGDLVYATSRYVFQHRLADAAPTQLLDVRTSPLRTARLEGIAIANDRRIALAIRSGARGGGIFLWTESGGFVAVAQAGERTPAGGTFLDFRRSSVGFDADGSLGFRVRTDADTPPGGFVYRDGIISVGSTTAGSSTLELIDTTQLYRLRQRQLSIIIGPDTVVDAIGPITSFEAYGFVDDHVVVRTATPDGTTILLDHSERGLKKLLAQGDVLGGGTVDLSQTIEPVLPDLVPILLPDGHTRAAGVSLRPDGAVHVDFLVPERVSINQQPVDLFGPGRAGRRAAFTNGTLPDGRLGLFVTRGERAFLLATADPQFPDMSPLVVGTAARAIVQVGSRIHYWDGNVRHSPQFVLDTSHPLPDGRRLANVDELIDSPAGLYLAGTLVDEAQERTLVRIRGHRVRRVAVTGADVKGGGTVGSSFTAVRNRRPLSVFGSVVRPGVSEPQLALLESTRRGWRPLFVGGESTPFGDPGPPEPERFESAGSSFVAVDAGELPAPVRWVLYAVDGRQ